MALPIWISGFTGSLPDALAWLINGSPDCCPELSNCYDDFIALTGDIWDVPGEEDLEDYKILGRKKFWNPLIVSNDPEYMALWHEFNDSNKLSLMLKNDVNMEGRRDHYEHYAEKCALLPPRQTYHGMQIRTANLHKALQWIPGSKAVWASAWDINNPTVIYNWTDMSVRANMENGQGRGLVIDDKYSSISWPPETGNSSNGYIPERDVELIASAYAKHVFANVSLWVKQQHYGVQFTELSTFMDPNKVMDIYHQLGIRSPDEQWVQHWLQIFRTNSNYNRTAYNPSLDDVKVVARNKLQERTVIENENLTDFEHYAVTEKLKALNLI